ncbi:metal-dependent hydrolase [Pseudobutyrivibrio sp.]|uniref:metal-dependent hydrolase n=1 Tax=Pseudobutyrivibrio sp. TaxID=2014367 RepID=UPI001DEBF892|nr:metal-dependent hydrolase [Pseudobutyrivibrio sp.]MBE5911737.1 metal-dependent hydrolase [Pseudobutyrivibrio sp.]
MLSMTHIAVGLASTIAVLSPQTPTELRPVVIGGAVGSIICDIDCKYGKSKDAVLGRAVAGVISAVALYIDIQNQGKIFFYARETSIALMFLGLAMIFVTGYFARESEHRFFSHSLLAFVLYSVGLYLMCRPLVLPFIIGFVSHLLLDLLNYRPVHLLFPYKNGFSLKLCKAKSKANIVIMIAGFILLAVELFQKILIHV